jgi:hypothetical protein
MWNEKNCAKSVTALAGSNESHPDRLISSISTAPSLPTFSSVIMRREGWVAALATDNGCMRWISCQHMRRGVEIGHGTWSHGCCAVIILLQEHLQAGAVRWNFPRSAGTMTRVPLDGIHLLQVTTADRAQTATGARLLAKDDNCHRHRANIGPSRLCQDHSEFLIVYSVLASSISTQS